MVTYGGLDVRSQMDTGPKWQLLTARIRSGMAQSEFATATGVSVRTLQDWEQGKKCPAGPPKAC